MKDWDRVVQPEPAHPEAAFPAGAAGIGWLLPLVVANLLCSVAANVCFKASAMAPTRKEFLVWQVVGNLSGFVTVLTLTGILRYLPLHVGFVVTTGLAVIGVQILAAAVVFREAISPAQWLGSLLVVLGIVLIGRH